jgi:hypothetical protein
MKNNSYPNCKSLILSVLEVQSFVNIKECRKKFILNALMCFASVKGKINFLQMQRFSGKCEQYFRINFENKFNFQALNHTMILEQKIPECVVAFDPSYILKSGKNTYGLGNYWSGCAKKAKLGLEICGFAAIDVSEKTAFHLNAIQTPPLLNQTLLEYYCQIFKENYLYFNALSKYAVADAYFSKKQVVDTILSTGMHFISRLRDDSRLNYIYCGEKTGKRGKPKKYDGKVDPKNPNMNYFKICYNTKELKIYNSIVYSVAFEQAINLSIAVFYNKEGKEVARKLYFSTDTEMDGTKIVEYYRSRFQIEFLYRDAKQHCGLNDCQARSKNKLDFHFNAALTTVNLAKIEWLAKRKNKDESFSMANFKTLYHNKLLLDRFICMFAINPNLTKNQKIINELCSYGLIAA